MKIQKTLIALITIHFLWPANAQTVDLKYLPHLNEKGSDNRRQCDSLLTIEQWNHDELQSPYQLQFFNQVPETRVDTLGHAILNSFYQRDTAEIRRLVDAIGQTQSYEGYCFLYTFCRGPEHPFHRLDPVFYLVSAVSNHGGFNALNQYYLSSTIPTSTDKRTYRTQILRYCQEHGPEVHFCMLVDPKESEIRLMRQADLSRIDKKIINTINKNPTFTRIQEDLLELPFVKDVYYQQCGAIPAFCPYSIPIGVIIEADGQLVEKAYMVKVGQSLLSRKCDHLKFVSDTLWPGCLQFLEGLCDPPPSPEDLFTVPPAEWSSMAFNDTLYNIAIDSTTHHITIDTSTRNTITIRKHLRYLGDEPVYLSNINHDPHFITEYNGTALTRGRVYSFTAILHTEDLVKNGSIQMGLKLSSGDEILVTFVTHSR